MDLICRTSRLRGEVTIPASKSHTIRAVAIASLARGESVIYAPLVSLDAQAAVGAYRALGAAIDDRCDDAWRITGTAGEVAAPADVIDVGNSGTTLRVALGSGALLRQGQAVFTGDEQIRRRPAGPLVRSLNELGADVRSTRENGLAPFVVGGRLRGGQTRIEAVTSQYLSSLLLNCPLAEGESVIDVPVLNEAPYVHLTLDWLERQGIQYERRELAWFRVAGGQRYSGFERRVPADFSSATFFLAAGALGGNEVTVCGLDMSDPQGDKAVIDYLRAMGADVSCAGERVVVRAGQLHGVELDLNATPDALPTMAVVGCFARGTTRLVNVPQARIKETDRIAVMAEQLGRMGGRVEELADGLVVHESPLVGATVEGHGDHRVVMALAVAGTAARGETRIVGADAMAVTFPNFVELMLGLGAAIERIEAQSARRPGSGG